MKRLSPPAVYPYISRHDHYAVTDFHPETASTTGLKTAQALKEAEPGCFLTFFSSEPCRSALENSPFIDQLVILSGNIDELIKEIPRLQAERSWKQFCEPSQYSDCLSYPEQTIQPGFAPEGGSRPRFGIAIFYNIGDILNATMVAHQLKIDYPHCHLVWYTADKYKFIVENNPHIDELIGLPGNPQELYDNVECLKTTKEWTCFITPAPYLHYDKVPGGTLAELIEAGAGMQLTVPFIPVFRLTNEEKRKANVYWQSLPEGHKILVETEFRSSQSPWTDEYAFDMLNTLREAEPVFVFTSKNKPPFFDRFAAQYHKAVWCDQPFRFNAELLNLCDAFIGVSSGISCLASSDYCRNDILRIEVSNGEHWSAASYKQNLPNLQVCFSRKRFNEALERLAIRLRGTQEPADFSPRFAPLAQLSPKIERIPCLLCGSSEYTPLWGDDIVKCNACDFVYLRDRMTREEMESYYKNIYTINNPEVAASVRVPPSVEAVDSMPEFVAAQRRALFNEAVAVYKRDIKGKMLIDIGCGWGALLYYAQGQGMNVMGFEFTQPNVEFGRNKLGLDIRQQQFIEADVLESSVDIVVMSHTLDHVPYPFEFIEKIAYVLKPEGIFYCIVPNFYSFCSNNLREKWAWLERQWHYSHFTPKVLREAFLQAGFIVEQSYTATGDYGEQTPLAILENLYPNTDSQQQRAILQELNRTGQGEELHIIGRKKGNSQNRVRFAPTEFLPKVILDGVFFQLYQTGIARVWRSLLEEWAENGFAKHIVVLDRAGTAPKVPGIRYRSVPPYNYDRTDTDREMLQQVCDEEGADLFISSYYTTPLSTPSVFMAYDMIPEVMGKALNHLMWQEKHQGIQHASAYIAISENTARDLVNFFPHISLAAVKVALCGIKSTFLPAILEEINSLKTKYAISKPYFILVGGGIGYKNSILFFKAFSKLYSKHGFEIVCTGSGSLLETEFRAYTSGSVVHMLQLSDEELRAAYSGAVALVYPSKYEGFGLPVLEAIACGCPVITCPNASIPEVAGEAALYVNDEDVDGLTDALCDVQKPQVRNSLIAAGLAQAKKFSWSKMAKTVSSALIEATLLPLNLKDINLIVFPDWSVPEESLCLDLQRVIGAIATHPGSSQITLLVDTGNISDEDAALILASVTMNLLLQEDLDVTEGLEISLVGKLGEIQWEALLPRIQARIVLENENQQAITQLKAETIPSCELDSFSNKQAAQLKPGIWDLTRHSEIVYFNSGMTLREQGKLAEAMSSYQKALEIRPDFPEARYQLSLTRYENQLILKGYQFTQDWFSGNVPIWEQHLKRFINIPTLNVLEIGSWEGRSTCWLLDNIMTHEHNTITCIDTFQGSVEHRYDHSYLQSIEGRFDFNIVRTRVPDKVKKIVGNSHEVMRSLPLNSYEIVYIDGSHIASDVLQDAVLVWQLLKVGGFIIFDDYPFTFPQNPAWNTKIGIDAFMISFSDKFRVIHKAYQVILEKTKT